MAGNKSLPAKGFTEEEDSFRFTFDSCVIVLGVLTNGFIILTFSLRRKLRSITNYFVVNLATSDFFLSLELILFLLAYRFKSDQIEIPLRIYNNIVTSFLTLGMSASPASLVMVSFDRYYAITQPLRYNSFFTHHRAIFFIVGIWVYATIMYLLNWLQLARLPEYPKFMVTLLAAGNFLIPLCAVAFFYCRILKAALSHLRLSASNKRSNSELYIRKKQLKIAFNVFVLIFPLLVVWSTYYVHLLWVTYCYNCGLSNKQSAVMGTLPHLVAAINPITYIILTKDFRALITTKCGGITRSLNFELGFHVDHFTPSAVTYSSQCSGVYRISSTSSSQTLNYASAEEIKVSKIGPIDNHNFSLG